MNCIWTKEYCESRTNGEPACFKSYCNRDKYDPSDYEDEGKTTTYLGNGCWETT